MNHQSKHLPPGWSRTRIGDFTAEKITQIKPAPPFNYIDISSINNTSKTIESPKKLTSFDTVPSRARQQLQSDDILVSMTRPNLNAVAQVPAEFNGSIASTGFHVLRPLSVSPDWLFAYVRSKDFIDSLVAHVQGALYPAIRPDDIRSHEIALPPLPEQRRIVAKIESLQERSSRARAALAEVGPLLEQFRRSVLSAAFSGRLTAQWRAANPDVEPASELLNRIRTDRRQRWEQAELAKYEAKGKKPPKNWQEKYQEPSSPDINQLPKLPPTWAWARLDALAPQDAPIVYGIILPGPHIPDGVPFVRPVDIRDGTVDATTLPRTTTEIAEKYQRAALRAGDLVFSIVGTIGKSLIVQDELDGANITQSSVRIRPLQPLTAEMLLQVLQSPTLTNQMEHLQFGNAVQRLNVEHMRSLAIPVPPLGEWREITKRVKHGYQSVQAMFHLRSSAASDLDQLDQSILAKAFRGELVPQDPADEPAAELLARIAAARAAAASSSKTTKRARKPAARKAANP